MGKKALFILMAVLPVLFFSCKPEPSLSFAPERPEIGSEGGSLDIGVKSNYAWKAASADTWIKVVTPSGESGTLTLRISPSNLTDPRTGTVKVTCEGLTRELQVVQGQKNTINVKDGDSINLSWEECTFDLPVETNVDFDITIECEGGWLNKAGVKSMTAKTVTFSATENPATASREALVSFVFDRQTIKAINVIQSGHPQSLKVWHTLTSFNAPVLFGFGMSAKVLWGDGQSDNYTSTLVHGYADGRLHEVTIEASGASTASLSSLVGIEKVDLSGF